MSDVATGSLHVLRALSRGSPTHNEDEQRDRRQDKHGDDQFGLADLSDHGDGSEFGTAATRPSPTRTAMPVVTVS